MKTFIDNKLIRLPSRQRRISNVGVKSKSEPTIHSHFEVWGLGAAMNLDPIVECSRGKSL